MKKTQHPLRSLACLALLVFSAGSVGADPAPSPKPTALVMKKSEIPLSVIKDIGRVHPGMTRGDLDWLFRPDGGLYTITPRTYIYRYAGAGVAAVDAAGKPLLDKTTHQPVVYGQAIKIDVKFRPATGRSWAAASVQGTELRFISSDGRPDDVIVSMSAPYVDFQNDN